MVRPALPAGAAIGAEVASDGTVDPAPSVDALQPISEPLRISAPAESPALKPNPPRGRPGLCWEKSGCMVSVLLCLSSVPTA